MNLTSKELTETNKTLPLVFRQALRAHSPHSPTAREPHAFREERLCGWQQRLENLFARQAY